MTKIKSGRTKTSNVTLNVAGTGQRNWRMDEREELSLGLCL